MIQAAQPAHPCGAWLRIVADLCDHYAAAGYPAPGPAPRTGWQWRRTFPALHQLFACYFGQEFDAEFGPAAAKPAAGDETQFARNAKSDRGFREAWLGIENLISHRSLYAHIHWQFCEAVAFFTACRRDPAVLFGVDNSPREGWIGWLAESAEYARAGFDTTNEGYDLADEYYAALIGDERRARANFGCLALLARDCFESLPAEAPNYLREPSNIDRTVGRFLDRNAPPQSSAAVVLVGEIAMLLAMVPEDPDLDHVLEMLGFPPGPRLPWGLRVWLDQLSGTLLSRLNAVPGC